MVSDASYAARILSAGLLAAWLMPGKFCRGGGPATGLSDDRLVLIELSSPPGWQASGMER
jgi:hypothetical protein